MAKATASKQSRLSVVIVVIVVIAVVASSSELHTLFAFYGPYQYVYCTLLHLMVKQTPLRHTVVLK